MKKIKSFFAKQARTHTKHIIVFLGVNLLAGIITTGVVVHIAFLEMLKFIDNPIGIEPTLASVNFEKKVTKILTTEEIKKNTANRIRAIAKERNFAWPDYAVNIACCESRLGTELENTKGNTPADSVDRGFYMFNSYWQKQVSDECAHNLDCSTNLFMDKVEAGYQGLWACDDLVKKDKNYSLNHCGVK